MSKSAESKFYEREEKPMSEGDRTKVSASLAEIDQEIKSVKEEKRNVNSKYRVRINDLEKRQDVLSRQIIDGVMEISFEVIEEHDDERLMVDIMRKDGGQRLSTRPMTEPEKAAASKRKQLKIPGTEDEGGIVDDTYSPTGTTKVKGKGAPSKRGGKK